TSHLIRGYPGRIPTGRLIAFLRVCDRQSCNVSTWSDEARDGWINRRAARREQANRPDSDLRVLREESLERERTEIHETLEDLTRKSAWELQKRPTRTYPAPFAGKLFLPLRYQDDDRKQSIKFAEGDDLNFLVYRFYDAKPDSGFQGTNYVTEDGITSKRHEYLGPTPHVAGYQLEDGPH
ncbi:hypothetical protein OH76DRAFT_1026213, partial [Lentinus brumalis]